MAIYTQFGVEVKIVAVDNAECPHYVTVQDATDTTWKRDRAIYELKADGGIEEIEQAIKAITTR